MDRSVLVIGAGIVGISTALHLQRRGWRVTVIDRRPPGSETSHGNAGVISRGSVIPLATPGLWRQLPGYLGNRRAALRYDWGYVLRHPGWFARFFACANRPACRRTARALNSLIAPALSEHKALLNAAGARDRLRETGWLKLYRSAQSFAASGFERQLLAACDIDARALDPAALHELEPDLAPIFAAALWVTGTASVDNPGAVTRAYARLFQRQGGRLRQESVLGLRAREQRLGVITAHGVEAVQQVVLAAGPWSAELLQPLGYKVPLAFERGYHCHLAAADGAALSRPIHDVQAGYVMTPTDRGLRLTTGVELAARDAPDRFDQLDQVMPRAREAFPLGARSNAPPWRGARPSLPDGRPIIGQAPYHPDLWLAFGHGHIGFSTGPTTGQMLAAMMSGQIPPIDPTPFRPTRLI